LEKKFYPSSPFLGKVVPPSFWTRFIWEN